MTCTQAVNSTPAKGIQDIPGLQDGKEISNYALLKSFTDVMYKMAEVQTEVGNAQKAFLKHQYDTAGRIKDDGQKLAMSTRDATIAQAVALGAGSVALMGCSAGAMYKMQNADAGNVKGSMVAAGLKTVGFATTAAAYTYSGNVDIEKGKDQQAFMLDQRDADLGGQATKKLGEANTTVSKSTSSIGDSLSQIQSANFQASIQYRGYRH